MACWLHSPERRARSVLYRQNCHSLFRSRGTLDCKNACYTPPRGTKAAISGGEIDREYEADFIDRIVFPYLGAHRKEVLVGPGHGLDNSVIDLGENQVLIATNDIIWYEPRFGLEDAAWAAWQVVGSDITTSGNPPAYIVVAFMLPMGSKEEDLEIISKIFHQESVKYNAAVVAGHSSPYPTCNYPTIGTITMMTRCSKDGYVTPQMAELGDVVLITKGAPITPAMCFARLFPNTIKREFGQDIFDESWQMFYQSSSMDDALIASSVGIREHGVTAMHDVTEGGVLNSIIELSLAANKGLSINLDAISIPPASKCICDFFDIDPLRCTSLGSLLITAKPTKVDEIVSALRARSINADVIGEVKSKEQGVLLHSAGKVEKLEKPGQDSLWPALFTNIGKGLA